MSLSDINIKIEYRSLINNMAKEFYVPLLREAVVYKRAVGFFSSSVLVEISKGIVGLVKNGGKIQLIASPYLSDEDLKAIRDGYEKREEIIANSLRKGMLKPKNKYQEERLNLLANLIQDGVLDIKIAITENQYKTGMYHEKVGIIADKYGNKLAFSGSMNESANSLLANYETIDVFCAWKSESDKKRVKNKEESFDNIWNNCEPNICTFKIDEISDEFIKKYKKSDLDYSLIDDSIDEVEEEKNEISFFKLPDNINFYRYQKDAISNWIKNSCCGILDMATGTGKTYTALGCISELSKNLDENIAVIIVVPYKHLVEQWIEDILKFNVKPIVAYSYKGQRWREEFEDAIRAYNSKAIKNFCIITTNATFSGDDFQKILRKFRRNYCFVVDEAHNIGAKKISKLLPKKARYRLALSATIERHNDLTGTEVLKKYFGPKCISFNIKDAIKEGFLTPYYYYPVIVYLNNEELSKYTELTKLIIKNSNLNKEEVEEGSYLEKLLIKRARIIAGCHSKIDALINVMEKYKDKNNILVYCGATRYDRSDIDDVEDIRQIDEVNYRLYNDLGMKVRKFTASENIQDRNEIKDMFVNGDIQVISAIKCLDEGVNIPAIKTAFILASSTNPKEYIQRRGRVLRKADGKEFAEIYDFITLPRKLNEVKYCCEEEIRYDMTLIKREFTRMMDFAENSRNPIVIDQLNETIKEAYTNNFIIEGDVLNEEL